MKKKIFFDFNSTSFNLAATHPPSIFGLPAATQRPPFGNFPTATKPTTTWGTRPPSNFQRPTTQRPQVIPSEPESSYNEILSDSNSGACGAKNGSPV